MKISVILPSLNPDEKLMLVVNGLIKEGFEDIIIVNDGSDEAHMQPFKEASTHKEVTILIHEVNKGKGRALKTAYEYCIANRPDIEGVVTVDGDNQHRPEDIRKCCEKMIEIRIVLFLDAGIFQKKMFRQKAGSVIMSQRVYSDLPAESKYPIPRQVSGLYPQNTLIL